MSQDFTGLLQAFAFQRAACIHLGSNFSARLMTILSEDIASGGAFAALATPWAGVEARQAGGDAAPLRFLGGLHYLALTGAGGTLAEIYAGPLDAVADDRLAAAAKQAGRAHEDALRRFLTSPPQTNEVRRSIALVGGFLTVAQRTGLPLTCLEIGASAGLNQNWDRYRYRFDAEDGVSFWGPPENGVEIDTNWRGVSPPLVPALVSDRRGCDLNPIDATDPDRALRLQAYVWADQPDRLARLRGAIALAHRFPPRIERADAAAWAAAQAQPRRGQATVLYHSVVWQYLPAATQMSISGAIEAAGAAAEADAPFAWLRMEPEGGNLAGPMEIRLTLWPGPLEMRLARVHPHGAEVSWLSGEA